MVDVILRWQWDTGGTRRQLAMAGEVAIGAIFPPMSRPGYWRWRAWHTINANQAEGSARSETWAKEEVEKRFRAFLAAAQLRPARPRPSSLDGLGMRNSG